MCAALATQKHYGVSKQTLHAVAVNIFTLHPDLHDLFSHYYLKYWSGTYFMDRMEDGTLEDGGKEYLVIYQHTTPFQVRRSRQVRLSFRAAIAEYGIPAYVIVRMV
jgi:hypothetical protein